MVWHKVPYVNFHDINLDWIVEKVVELDKAFNTTIAEKITEYINEHLSQFIVMAMYDEENTAIQFYPVEITDGSDHVYSNQVIRIVGR